MTQVRGFTHEDWNAVPSYMFSADQDRPKPPCYCAGCTSEGRLPQGPDCEYWVTCDPEAGKHGDACECFFAEDEE